MKIAVFCQSILSDYNFSSAHFLRGIVHKFSQKGHQVKVFEKINNPSVLAIQREFGKTALNEFRRTFPGIEVFRYESDDLNLEKYLQECDLALVHSSTDPREISLVIEIKEKTGLKTIFYDTGFSIINNSDSIKALPIAKFDLALVSGKAIEKGYKKHSINPNIRLWHLAADTLQFQPRKGEWEAELLYVGNWNEGEKWEMIQEYLIKTAKDLRIRGKIYGVKYPKAVKMKLNEAGIECRGWVPSFRLPEIFPRFTTKIHLPAVYQDSNQDGLTTMGLFESFACCIPTISAPWNDTDKLFTPGREFLVAKDTYEMKHFILEMMNSTLREVITSHALKAILQKHNCHKRVEEFEAGLRESGLMMLETEKQE